MRIQRIKIQNFRGLSDVTIDNLDPKLNLLMGVNGAGKSSILDAIVVMLSSYVARFTTKNSRGLKFSKSDIKNGSHGGCSLSIKVDGGVEWKRFSTKALEDTNKGNFKELDEYTSENRKKIGRDELFNLPIIVHYGVNRFLPDVIFSPKRRKDDFYLDSNMSNEVYTDWKDKTSRFADFFEWFKEEEDMENAERIEDNNFRNQNLELIRKVFSVCFPEYKNIRVSKRPRTEILVDKNDVELSLNQLSDGEKCYISLVCDIARRLIIANPDTKHVPNPLDGEGIVLIDEIDLHLHPSWEATVMEKLTKTFPNIQFIVSAHSPLVASNFKGKVYAINQGNVIPLPSLLGLNYSTILQDWMMSDSGNKDLDILERMFKAYKENGMQKQAYEVFQKIYDMTDGDVTSPYYLNLIKE